MSESEKIVQKSITLSGISVPVVVCEGLEYYPVSFISEKILLRNSLVLTKDYKKYKIRKFGIKFDSKLRNIQETNCIRRDMLIDRLKITQSSRLSIEQIKNQNVLHKYLGIELLVENEKVINTIPRDHYKLYDKYTSKLLQSYIDKDIKYQLCSKCNKYLPINNCFFRLDKRMKNRYFGICIVCEGISKFYRSEDKQLNKLKMVSEDLYKSYVMGDAVEVYKSYISGKIKSIPEKFNNKESCIEIIKYLLSENKISLDELGVSKLCDVYRLRQVKEYFTTDSLHFELFGEDCIYYPWIYPNVYRGSVHSFELAKKEFDNYLEEFNIKIENKFNFKYGEIVTKARIHLKDLLGFVVYYHDYKYAGYKYRVSSSNYYKIEENVLLDIKYLIEQDMNLDVDKIPLYLTKTSLRNKSASLYRHIVTKKNGNIFYWVNKVYPNKFIELDFDINYYREIFDSVEEGQIHELLVSEISGVIYNGKIDGKRLFSIGGMEPDWLVVRDDKCWIIEYFGIYNRRNEDNSRVTVYMDKTKKKIAQYEKLDYYGKIYLYPEDIEDNFIGTKNKIAILK